MSKTWLNPAIQDTLDWNLFESLSEIATRVKDEKNKDSIQALKQLLTKELANVDKAFPEVRSCANHLIALGVALGVKKLAKGKSKHKEAYKQDCGCKTDEAATVNPNCGPHNCCHPEPLGAHAQRRRVQCASCRDSRRE
eukprot:3352737-Rhodomonas_salina.1